MMNVSRYGTVIVIIAVVAAMFGALSLGEPLFVVRVADVGDTTFYSDHATFERTGYWYSDWVSSYNHGDPFENASDLMLIMSILTVLWLLFVLGFVTTVLNDGKAASVIDGVIAISIGVAALVYFSLRMPDIAGVDGFVGSGTTTEGHDYSWRPLEGWIYMLVATVALSIAVAIRAIVVARDLPPDLGPTPGLDD